MFIKWRLSGFVCTTNFVRIFICLQIYIYYYNNFSIVTFLTTWYASGHISRWKRKLIIPKKKNQINLDYYLVKKQKLYGSKLFLKCKNYIWSVAMANLILFTYLSSFFAYIYCMRIFYFQFYRLETFFSEKAFQNFKILEFR